MQIAVRESEQMPEFRRVDLKSIYRLSYSRFKDGASHIEHMPVLLDAEGLYPDNIVFRRVGMWRFSPDHDFHQVLALLTLSFYQLDCRNMLFLALRGAPPDDIAEVHDLPGLLLLHDPLRYQPGVEAAFAAFRCIAGDIAERASHMAAPGMGRVVWLLQLQNCIYRTSSTS